MAVNQFVTFKLGKERYCIDILNVSSITEKLQIIRTPEAPNFIDGIMNLRGDIIPIVNLKERFGLANKTYNSNSRIIVIHLDSKFLGFLVDEANQVLSIDESEIDVPPTVLKGKDYISGIGKHGGKMYVVLKLENILSHDEIDQALKIKTA